MKIQAHNNEVRPLVRHSYEKVYDQLSKLLSADEFIFAKWEAGFGNILQWTLPADYQWRCLTQADSLDRNAVSAEFLRRLESARPKLGTNQELIKNIFSVPAESYVYYTILPDGSYRVMLAAWGYAFPQQSPCDSTLISHGAVGSQHVMLSFIENGLPAAGLQFSIQRDDTEINRIAGNDGQFELGSLAPGERIQVTIPSVGKTEQLMIVNGKEFYTIDITQEMPKPQPAPQPTPQPEPEPTPLPEPEPEPEPVDDTRHHDISLRFITADGKAIEGASQAQAELTDGTTTIIESLDADGTVWLDKRDFAPNAALTATLINTPTQYDKINLTLEPDETQYEIVLSISERSNLWEIVAFAAGALVLAALGWWTFASLSHLL